MPAILEAPPPSMPTAWAKRDVAAFLGVSVRTVENLVGSDPTFPAPRYVGRLPRWNPETVRAWLDHVPPKRPTPKRRGHGRIK